MYSLEFLYSAWLLCKSARTILGFLKIDHINVSKYLIKMSVRNHVTIYYRLHLFAPGNQAIDL
jgi:hypothetical protein